MIRMFLNGVAASAGGGLTYLLNVIPHLSVRNDVQTVVGTAQNFHRQLPELPNVSFVKFPTNDHAALRFWREQKWLPGQIRASAADVLISTGNFALRRSPVPQILLSRNALYTSKIFLHDLCSRSNYRLWGETYIQRILARKSIQWADCTVAPSQAFADELRRWTGRTITAIHHGFDRDAFINSQHPLSGQVQQKLDDARDALRLLFISHYNYYRNFETLFRAIPPLRERLSGKKIRLFLTCKLEDGSNPGSYRTQNASSLISRLGICEEVVQLGSVPYHLLHRLYRACQIYVTPAYAESFAHPLVEAMASGLPVVASDLAVHREICGDAALYFDKFSPSHLADEVLRLLNSPALMRDLAARGQSRSEQFSWSQHVDEIVHLAQQIITTR
jgi:glycosyltransferase involved in cell wall biosynthesis